jgi:hypothetical protein
MGIFKAGRTFPDLVGDDVGLWAHDEHALVVAVLPPVLDSYPGGLTMILLRQQLYQIDTSSVEPA